jgi:L-cysteine S-thiosulfotransferase
MPGTRRSRARCLGSLLLLLLAGAGDPVRGEAVVTRQSSTCTLCHAGPFPNPHLQGDVGPDLRGVGGRLSESELRDRLVDASRVNPATVMPSFYRTEGLTRVGVAWRGKPILSAQEIEDAVAYLATLK